ncbi:flagellar basal-body rod protein FlgG [Candidatus Margulisiibacteriota bacterium]
MFEPLYVAATGMNVFEDEMVDITNNLANARTVGFKRGRTEKENLFTIERSFQKELREQMLKEGVIPPYGPSTYGTGVRVAATTKDFGQGTIEITNNPLDVAIQGEGFFRFMMPDGEAAYGRAGNLHVDNEGNLVDPNGYKIQPAIVIPEGATGVIINQDGTVLASVNNSTEPEEVGQLTLTRFVNAGGLEGIGQNLFKMTESAGEPIEGIANQEGFGSINQFSLETSNVDVISEMMRMVMIQRVFDTVAKAVQSYDAMLTALERIKQ